MAARFTIALTLVALASSAAAEPAKQPRGDGSESDHPAVVLAAADQTNRLSSPGDQTASQPVKRPRAARVTSCRCGDEQTQERQQP